MHPNPNKKFNNIITPSSLLKRVDSKAISQLSRFSSTENVRMESTKLARSIDRKTKLILKKNADSMSMDKYKLVSGGRRPIPRNEFQMNTG